MRSAVELAVRPEFGVYEVACRDDHRGWSAPEPRTGYGLVLVRRGRFRLRVARASADVDATVGYVSLPDDEECFAHPHGGDLCTSVRFTTHFWRTITGAEVARPARPGFYVDAGVDLGHRRLLAAARTGDVDYALAEQLLGLLVAALRRDDRTTDRRSAADQLIVGQARAAIIERHPAATGLLPLAELLGVSPYRLSRAFSRELGVSLTRYRNRLRVGWALDRLEAGEPSLAALAADLGFADQAHLTRTVRDHAGHTPVALRRLLAPHST